MGQARVIVGDPSRDDRLAGLGNNFNALLDGGWEEAVVAGLFELKRDGANAGEFKVLAAELGGAGNDGAGHGSPLEAVAFHRKGPVFNGRRSGSVVLMDCGHAIWASKILSPAELAAT